MDIYRQDCYRQILKEWLKVQPKQGRGVAGQMAKDLRISSVLMSQILSGTRVLQFEYAFAIAKFMGLTTNETDYFLLLVQYENAGTDDYKKHLKKKILSAQNHASEIKNRVARDIQLSEEARAKFYSHWHYSAIRLMTDIPEFQLSSTIAKALNLEPSYVAGILEFLCEQKLCVEENSKFKMAVKSTHLESGSPWIFSRQIQWRQKAMQVMETQKNNDVYYTGPMVMSEADAKLVRDKMLHVIREVTELARDSKSEKLMCLNLDWFQVY